MIAICSLWLLACHNTELGSPAKVSSPKQDTTLQMLRTFSPALIDIVHTLEWRYQQNCLGVRAIWSTSLPKDTPVQLVAGPKIEGGHFDDDALQDIISKIDAHGKVQLNTLAKTPLKDTPTFINIRVWAHNTDILERIETSQDKGGFPVSPGPDGAYAWAEALVPPCAY